MSRIPTAELDRLKREVSLLRLVESSGIELKKHGKDYLGLCPFHDDKEPSLVISPDKNLWHCLGACSEGGDVIAWMMKRRGVSFRHAVEMLEEDCVSVPAAGHGVVAGSAGSLVADANDRALLERVIDYYHATLKQSPDALAYLNSRGLDHAELIGCFRLGYANRTLGYRLPAKTRKAGVDVRAQLQRIGIVRASGHEHFNGSLVIPVMDERGRVCEVYGRKIGQRLRQGTPRHLYLPGAHEGVFNGAALAAGKEIILCESLIDALTFWNAGYRNVTAGYGVNGFTDEILQAFKAHGIARVLIAYDRDGAGDSAAAALSKRLIGAGMDCFRILFPKGMDANEYALKVTPAVNSLGLVIRKAQWLGRGEAPRIDTARAAMSGEVVSTGETATGEGQAARLAGASLLPEPASASPLPPTPGDVDVQVSDHQVVLRFADRPALRDETSASGAGHKPDASLIRCYRVRGLENNVALDALRVNILVSLGDRLHVDTFDLQAMKPRHAYSKQASIELGVEEALIRGDLVRVLLTLEQVLEEQSRPKIEPVSISARERACALAFLKRPDLLERIVTDIARCGVVGEADNALVSYLACISRKLDKPLAVLIQSTSAAGKSALMDAVLELMPAEDREQYSAMTGQSLYYMGDGDLRHKILAIAEEEGVRQAAYALKLLQSQGELTMASTGKDPVSGELKTRQYRVQGPVMLFLTTTACDVDEELHNRCLVLSVNESREQTRIIHTRQRFEETLEGLLAREDRDELIELHRNAQRLLRPLKVVNPHAGRLTFLDDQTRLRRDHMKYLGLIRCIALLHQHQRPIRSVVHKGKTVEYIEVTVEDIAVANRLAHEVLGRCLDELPPQTRRLLGLICAMVDEQATAMERGEYRFSRRELRERIHWGDTQLKVHLHRLDDMEYVRSHRGPGGRYRYELVFDGDPRSSRAHLPGLIEVEKLGYDEKRSGRNAARSGHGRGLVGSRSEGGRGAENSPRAGHDAACGVADASIAESVVIRNENNHESYRSDRPLA